MTFESYANGWPDLKQLQELAEKVGAMPTFTSTDKAALEEFIENEQAIIAAATLANDVGELQTTVGDASSGLVKDVDDLQTTVGDNTAGLVKDVADLKTANEYQNTEVTVGKWGQHVLYRKVVNFGGLPNATSKAVSTGLTNVTYRMFTVYATSDSALLQLPNVNLAVEPADVTRAYIETGDNNIRITASGNMSSFSGVVIVYYTKNPPTRDDDTNNEPNEKEDK